MPKIVDVEMPEPCRKVLFAQGVRHKVLVGGRASAKSWSAASYLVIRAAEACVRILCCRQYQNSIRDSSKGLIERRIEALGLSDEFIITDQAIVHKRTGSDFLFYGLERNIDSVRSLEGTDICWIEEAAAVSARSMEVLIPTIRKKGAEFLWTYNPNRPTDPVDVLFGPARRALILFWRMSRTRTIPFSVPRVCSRKWSCCRRATGSATPTSGSASTIAFR